MAKLSQMKCEPCQAGAEPLKGEELQQLHRRLDGWDVVEEHHLAKTFKFPSFAESLDFVNRVAALAEEQGHHPWIHFTWGIVKIEIYTHKVDGLHQSDFVLAAKIDKL